MTIDLARYSLEDIAAQFRVLKKQADRAVGQVSDEQFFQTIDPESNSLAILMKHVGGNLRSRWTDVLTSDGEKPDRNRDDEFVIPPGTTRAAIVERWELGWSRLFGGLESLAPDDLLTKIMIRGEPHTVVQAIHRSLWHVASHVGQIVYLAKHLRGAEWQTLSIPRGKTREFNEKMRARAAERQSGLSWR